MILSDDQVRALADETLAQLDLTGDWAVVLEGSIAEGFGNPSSDIDFLLILDDDSDPPTMPSLLFVSGRRVEVRTRSAAQVTEALRRVRSARRVDALSEDLLNRCQRLLGGYVVRGEALVARLRDALPRAEFAGLMRRWWAHYARQSMRQALALAELGCRDEAGEWARAALVQAAKAWAAEHGETYLEPKWLSLQFERIGDTGMAERYWRASESDDVAAAAALSAQLGVTGCTGDPDALTLAAAPGVTTWPIGERVHVVRGGLDVFALGAEAARVWRAVVFGRSLADTLAAVAHVPDAGELLADFARFGLVRFAWRGTPVRPALPLGAPAGPITPPPGTARPPLQLHGAVTGGPRAVELVPMPAVRFGAAAMNLVWSNIVIENVLEDLTGALARQQWRVAELSARRVALACARSLLSAYGVDPLPADSDVIRRLALLGPQAEKIHALAEAATGKALDCSAAAQRLRRDLDDLVAATRSATGAGVFPASFDSARAWEETLAIGYDWLRLGAYLDADLPIDEARDLLHSGGGQPHRRSAR